MLSFPLPLICDPEAEHVPAGLPPVTDSHVHFFPAPIFHAIWSWFDQWAWPVRYQLTSELILQFLQSKGISKVIGLHYAHKQGIARDLNKYMLGLMAKYPFMQGTATVFPGESRYQDILVEAFAEGLVGVKLHAHVQYFDLKGDDARRIYEICEKYDQPLVMHVGRAPKNPDFPYKKDPYKLCYWQWVDDILNEHPSLRLCVPHLGADEFQEYKQMITCHDNLWLDTSMVMTDYMRVESIPAITEFRTDRIMFGTDFPQIPFAWNHELDCLLNSGLGREALDLILSANSAHFFRGGLSNPK